ncbi:MAG: hypothetical protein R3B82_07330 [Sandaracinaceae bacterium]
MHDKLKAFVKLAEIDASARHLEEQLEGIPLELEERRTAVQALRAAGDEPEREMDRPRR